MNNKYLDAFFECVTWQFKKKDILRMEKEEKNYSSLFVETFPKLSILLSKAIVFRIILKDDSYFQLVCWENNGLIGGWLCQNCEEFNTDISDLNFLKKVIGTIIESWGFGDIREDLFCNMNAVLIDDVQYGIGAWKDYYKESCEFENLLPQIKDDDYVVVAEEANGNLTLCDKYNGKIVLFAPDHCFDYVKVYAGCPEYTFYTVNNVDSLIDYFELVAQQWLAYLE